MMLGVEDTGASNDNAREHNLASTSGEGEEGGNKLVVRCKGLGGEIKRRKSRKFGWVL
jgi:hypothetical protein